MPVRRAGPYKSVAVEYDRMPTFTRVEGESYDKLVKRINAFNRDIKKWYKRQNSRASKDPTLEELTMAIPTREEHEASQVAVTPHDPESIDAGDEDRVETMEITEEPSVIAHSMMGEIQAEIPPDTDEDDRGQPTTGRRSARYIIDSPKDEPTVPPKPFIGSLKTRNKWQRPN